MILSDFKINSLSNVELEFTGMDSLENCLDKNHFKNYPYKVSYKYNSRGFRDDEWPENLEDCIWCFGDSFTKGLGQNYKNTWPKVLQLQLDIRTICMSMDGASNEWLSRKIVELVKTLKPKAIIVQWSFVNRRERILNTSESAFDEDRRIWFNENSTSEEDILNTVDCITRACTVCEESGITLIHSFIPDFIKISYYRIFFDKFKKMNKPYISLTKIDKARDFFHYDIKTVNQFVKNILTSGYLNI
jgi:hypothetical protein